MKSKFKDFINSKDIKSINEATIVLRHFIGLNAKLLPILNEISQKENLTDSDITNRDKILSVFKSYRFETDTSIVLMNSDILALIKGTFQEIERNLEGDETAKGNELVQSFVERYSKISHEWVKTEMN